MRFLMPLDAFESVKHACDYRLATTKEELRVLCKKAIELHESWKPVPTYVSIQGFGAKATKLHSGSKAITIEAYIRWDASVGDYPVSQEQMRKIKQQIIRAFSRIRLRRFGSFSVVHTKPLVSEEVVIFKGRFDPQRQWAMSGKVNAFRVRLYL